MQPDLPEHSRPTDAPREPVGADENDTMISSPAADGQGAASAAAVNSLPEQIGPYVPLRLLGEGGMGTVYLAEQQRPRRLVALKLMRSGHFSSELSERFRREAEFLGQLEHPGIARIFDAGEHPTASARIPYLAMEYVDGTSLREHCQQTSANDRTRLQLVAHVARAVHHAHVRGVVHRDLKPGNVLVGADGQPRVLDFGIALALGEESDPQRLTQMGELVGTLSYMSPEQIGGDTRRVDQRSDVYALGVILYELLSGEYPHALQNTSLIEAARIVSEQPPRALAKRRPELAGDVDTLVMKALETDRDRRYQSAGDFADDIERYLENRPILARPATATYLTGKFFRRHRIATAAAAVVLLSLLAAVGVSLHFAIAEAQARREAVARAESNEAVSRFLIDMLTSADPERSLGNQLTLRQALDGAADSASATLSEQPAVQAQIKGTLATTYRSIGELDRAEKLYAEAFALTPQGNDEVSMDMRLGLLTTWLDAGRNDEALAEAEAILKATTQRSALNEQRLHMQLARGRALLGLGRNDEGLQAFREVKAVSDANPQLDPEIGIAARHNLASALRTTSAFAESESMLRELRTIRAARHGEDHPQTLFTRNNLAAAIQLQGRDAEAEAEFRSVLKARQRVLGPEHLSTLATTQNLANLLIQQTRHAEAEPLIRGTAEVTERVFGAEHPRTQMAQNSLAYLLEDLGQLDEAEALHRRILALQNARLEAGESIDSELLATRNNLAMLLTRKGQFEEGLSQFDILLKAALAALPEDHAYVAIFRSNYGDSLNKAGKPALARPLLEAAFPILEKSMGAQHKRTRDVAERLATTYSALGLTDQAKRFAAIAAG
ncbi:MAG: protein kinase domain-containing protein [Pseudomarimonas sp.]